MLLEAFSQTILRWLRIPPGASLRKSDGPSTGSTVSVYDNDYIRTILDITVDDICIGDSPLSINFDSSTPEDVQLKLKAINSELNDVVKWVARDLCARGYSVYDIYVNEQNRMVAMPYIEEVEFYLTDDKKVVVYPLGNKDKKSLTDKLIFINFSKDGLQSLEGVDLDKSIKFKVNPIPMQLQNVEGVVSGLQSAEKAISRYRTQLSKIVRFANVDIGSAQGDTQKDVIDSISSAINANSSSLGDSYTEFDDNIPVLPNRRGLGKVELVTDTPSADIKELADLQYWLGKLNLMLRFPSSYLDFSTNLDSTAVSLIRGDLRYAKLCASVRTKIVRTLNEFISSSKFSKYYPVFSLTQLPTSEDDDVISALDSFLEIVQKVDEFILSDDDQESAIHRLEILQGLLATSVSSPSLQSWFEEYRDFIKQKYTSLSKSKASGASDIDLERSRDVELSPDNEVEDTDFDEEVESPEEGIEFIEPQSDEV